MTSSVAITPTDSWKFVALGLRLKLIAMWLILPAILLAFLLPYPSTLLVAILLPLGLDLVGRYFCMRVPWEKRFAIKMSLAAQFTGIGGMIFLCALTSMLENIYAGIVMGTIWAGLLQVAAAKWFIKHLKAIAEAIDEPIIANGMDHLNQRLIATSLSVYGTVTITVIVMSVAVAAGLMMFFIGVFLTVPLGLMVCLPFVVSSLVFYFFMLMSYERQLSDLRIALESRTRQRS